MNDLPVFQEEDIGQYGKIYKLANKGGVGGNNSLRLFKLYDDGGKERKSGTYMECAYTARKKNLQNFKIREVVETENNFNIKGTGLKESNKINKIIESEYSVALSKHKGNGLFEIDFHDKKNPDIPEFSTLIKLPLNNKTINKDYVKDLVIKKLQHSEGVDIINKIDMSELQSISNQLSKTNNSWQEDLYSESKIAEKKEKNKTVEGWAKELNRPYEEIHKYWLRAEKKADKSLPEKRYWAEVNSIAQKMLGAKYGEFKSKKESLMKKPTQKPIKESRRIAIVVKSTKNLTESLLCEEDLFNEVVQSIFSDTEDQIDIQGVADMLELERVNGEPMEVEPEEVIAVLEDMDDVTVVEVDSHDEIPELLSDENLGLFDTIEMMADKHAENQYAKVDEDNFTVKQPLQLDNVQPDSDEQILLDDEYLDVYGMQPAMYEAEDKKDNWDTWHTRLVLGNVEGLYKAIKSQKPKTFAELKKLIDRYASEEQSRVDYSKVDEVSVMDELHDILNDE